RTDKPSVVKAVTLEVDAIGGEKVALASRVGSLSLMLRKAGEVGEAVTRRVTIADLGHAAASPRDTRFVTIGVMRMSKKSDYSVPVESEPAHAAALMERRAAQD
ncbi:MAG: hypothetical protein KGL96_15390, partial [Hyphomicrobiales bacterium]|nr:hypothetical protein [Hyphomicrobiales bacterium]